MNGGQKRRWWGEKAWDEVKVAGPGGWGDENEQLSGQVEQSELRAASWSSLTCRDCAGNIHD